MSRYNRKKQKEKGPIRRFLGTLIWNLTFAAALGVFIISAGALLRIYLDYRYGEKEYAEIQNLAVASREPEAEGPEAVSEDGPDAAEPGTVSGMAGPVTELSPDTISSPGAEVSSTPPIESRELTSPPVTIDFQVLQEMNADVRGWLYIEALGISYPIVQGVDNQEYLNKTYEGVDNPAGSIFMDAANNGDFSDGNTIIYGHNMKNQTMFGKLKFLDTQERYKDSIYFWVMTPEKNMYCQIIAAYYTEDASEVYTLFAECGEEFLPYIRECMAMNILPLEQPAAEEIGRLITLSTCAAANSSQRFVVQGRVIQESSAH